MQVVKTVCGMCGGDNCGIDVFLDNERIVDVKGMQEFPTNRGKLCPQARAAIELTYAPQRLQYPMRRDGDGWRRISWDEALDLVAEKFKAIIAESGPDAVAGVSCARSINEDSYNMQKFFRAALGTNNIVHCART